MALDPIQQSNVIASLGEFGEFEKINGGVPTTAFTEYTPPGARSPEHLPGITTYTDLVLSRAYRPDRDQAVVNWHKQYALGQETPRNVIKQIRNYQGAVIAQETYSLCKPVSVETPEGQTGNADLAMITVTLRVTAKL